MSAPDVAEALLGDDVAAVCGAAARVAAYVAVGEQVRPRSVRNLAASLKRIGPLFGVAQEELRVARAALEAERAAAAQTEARLKRRLRRAWWMQQVFAVLGVLAGYLMGVV